jgi:hypothetical protein
MASHQAIDGKRRDVLLVLIVALFVSGLDVITMGIPEAFSTANRTTRAPAPSIAIDAGWLAARSTRYDLAPSSGLSPDSNRTSPDPTPVERFIGEGAGREVMLATSSGDARAFLMDTTETLRDLAHIGGCELTERPLGGTTRRCASATERMLVAVSHRIRE